MAWTQADFNKSVDAGFLADGIVIPSYDRALKWALIPQLLWRQFIDVEPVDLTNNSNIVNLKRHVYLTVTASDLNPIDEVAAPDVTKAPQTFKAGIAVQPKSRRVFVLKYRKPGGSVQQRAYRSEGACRSRIAKLQALSADTTVCLFVAKVGEWERII